MSYRIELTPSVRAKLQEIADQFPGTGKSKSRLVAEAIRQLERYEISAIAPANETKKLILENGEVYRLSDFDQEKPSESELSGIILRNEKVSDGFLISANPRAFDTVLDYLLKNWDFAYQIKSETWEELIAGAFERAGFQRVILTPRSGDLGRDLIATKSGRFKIKIVGSVKAYHPGRLVRYDDVRSLLHVLNAERDATHGIVATTSGFPPRIKDDPLIQPYLGKRPVRPFLTDLAGSTVGVRRSD